MDQPIEVQIAVHEERLEQLEQEQLRHRTRLHQLEADRAALQLIARQVTELAANIETTAKRAALEAIDLAMQARDELGRKRWGLRTQWVSVGVAFGGLAVAVVELAARH